MFFKAAFVTLAVSLLVAANTTISANPPQPTPEPANQCSTGDAQCCNTATTASNPAAASILKSLGVVVQGANVLVGLTCTPITLVGGTGVCSQQALCCSNNEFEGLINIGCTPITL